MLFEVSSRKNFTIFTRKHLCWGLFLRMLQVFRRATFLKRDSNTGVSCGYLEKYLVGFFIFAEISQMLKKKRLEKLVFPVK